VGATGTGSSLKYFFSALQSHLQSEHHPAIPADAAIIAAIAVNFIIYPFFVGFL
jgi:hypothetical protein